MTGAGGEPSPAARSASRGRNLTHRRARSEGGWGIPSLNRGVKPPFPEPEPYRFPFFGSGAFACVASSAAFGSHVR